MIEINEIYELDINGILKYHNCKYPCLMIDHCEKIVPGKYVKAYKNFTYNEWFFPAHFENDPNVPSSIQIESMSQTLLMGILTMPGYENMNTACLKINNVEFKRKIKPGERLDLEADIKSFRGGVAIGQVVGFVKMEKACCADFIIGIPEILAKFTPESKKGN